MIALVEAALTLSARCRLVRGQNRAGGRRLALDESQRPLGSVIGQETLAAAEDERDDHQPEAVHEIGFDERLRQPTAADNVEIAAFLRLQRTNRLRDVAPENVCVLPVKWVGECSRRHMFRQLVQGAGDRLLVVARVRPVARKELERPAAEEEAAGRLVTLDEPPLRDLVEVGEVPAAVAESPREVVVRTAGLDDAVDAQNSLAMTFRMVPPQ